MYVCALILPRDIAIQVLYHRRTNTLLLSDSTCNLSVPNVPYLEFPMKLGARGLAWSVD
jgi:hypothetical protein